MSLAAVLDRVADQVGQDPLHPARIGRQRQRTAAHRDPGLPAPRADQRGRDRPNIDHPPLDGLGPGIEHGDLHQLVDQRPEPAYVGDQQLDRTAGRVGELACLFAQHRGLGDQRGQRRPQLVRDVRGEPALAVLRGNQFRDLRLERVGHLVERCCPGAELIRRASGQPGLKPALAMSLAASLALATGSSVRRASVCPISAASSTTPSQAMARVLRSWFRLRWTAASSKSR